MAANVYVGLGDYDQLFQWLEKAESQHDVNLGLNSDPMYDPLRCDPRFRQWLTASALE